MKFTESRQGSAPCSNPAAAALWRPRFNRYAFIACAVVFAGLPWHSTLAQNGDSFLRASESQVPFTETPFPAQKNCSDFISRTVSEYTILSAQLHTGEENVPDHCRLSGVIPPEILFEINLPLAWARTR